MDQKEIDQYTRIANATRPFKGTRDRFILDNRTQGTLGIVGLGSGDRLDEYFSLKFEYFLEKLGLLFPERQGELEFGPRPSDPTAWREGAGRLLAIWDQVFADECKAYLLRTAQTARKAVIEAWYNDLEPFQRWASFLDQVSSDELGVVLGSPFPLSVEAERQDNIRFHRMHTDLQEHLGVPMAVSSAVAGFRTAHVDGVLARLAERLNEVLLDPEAEFEGAVKEVVKVIAEAFGVRICDFLHVETVNAQRRLEVLASSSPEDIQKIHETEASYEAAEGITGTVLLLSRDEAYRWVGTGLLDIDPRAGVLHKEAWGHVYGSVESFWVFPIFSGSAVEGALRVIDVADNGYIRSFSLEHPWSYAVRAELAHIADWLGTVLGLVKTALPLSREESLVTAIARSRRAEAAPGKSTGGLLPWIPLRYLAGLLESLTRLALMRSEHRSVGCMVAVGTPEVVAAFVGDNKVYASIPTDMRRGPLDGAADYFGRVLPGAGVFVCELPEPEKVDVPEIHYSNVVATTHLDPAGVLQRFGQIAHLCFVVVDGARSVIRMYSDGAGVADYFLNEKSGTWQLRIAAQSEGRVAEAARSSFPESLIQATVRHVIDYSYEGSGGLVVIGKGPPPRDVVSRDGFKIDEPVSAMDPRLFASVAAVDGGTWIDAQSGRVSRAGILFMNEGEGDDEAQSGGARHKAAKSLWHNLDDAIIFAVSANRTVSVYTTFKRGGSTITDEFAI